VQAKINFQIAIVPAGGTSAAGGWPETSWCYRFVGRFSGRSLPLLC